MTAVDLIERVADPSAPPLDELWEKEWQQNLLDVALTRLKRRLDARNLQIFDFYVQKGIPAEEVASRFRVPVEQVYLAKHRVTEALREEIKALKREDL